ncbi:MAG: hypothetical protein ABIH86_06570 [Planctomycetota bacterium]
MSVSMRITCSACRYTWDRTVELDDANIVCPACGNDQENFDEETLESMQSVQRKQSFLALISVLCFLAGVACIVAVLAMVNPKNYYKEGDLLPVSSAQSSDVQAAARAISPYGKDEELTPDRIAALSELRTTLEDNGRIYATCVNGDKQIESAIKTSWVSDDKALFQPKVEFKTAARIQLNTGFTYTDAQSFFGVLGAILMLAGLIVGYPAQSKRYIAEI